MKIEAVDEHNVAYAVALCRELVSLGSFGDSIGFDWDHAMRSARNALRSGNYYLHIAKDDADSYCGIVAGHMDTFVFAPVLYAQEDCWYVREGTPFRAKVAMALMRGFVKWAMEDRGARLIQSGDVAAINTVAVDGLYKHIGFRRFGTIYKYERGA
jgi:hypothetical protein